MKQMRLLTLIGLLLTGMQLHAQNVWDGSASSSFSDPANWAGDSIPEEWETLELGALDNGEDLVFDDAGKHYTLDFKGGGKIIINALIYADRIAMTDDTDVMEIGQGGSVSLRKGEVDNFPQGTVTMLPGSAMDIKSGQNFFFGRYNGNSPIFNLHGGETAIFQAHPGFQSGGGCTINCKGGGIAYFNQGFISSNSNFMTIAPEAGSLLTWEDDATNTREVLSSIDLDFSGYEAELAGGSYVLEDLFDVIATGRTEAKSSFTITQTPAAGTAYTSAQTVSVELNITDYFGNNITQSVQVTIKEASNEPNPEPVTADLSTDVDHLKRSVVAVKDGDNGIFVSWALFRKDTSALAFNVYRIADGGTAELLNDSPITNSTNYYDSSAVLTSVNEYFVKPVLGGVEQDATETVSTWAQQYMSVPVQAPTGGTTPDNVQYTYTPNDISAADLDGDGELELVVKWEPTNAKDNSNGGYTGKVYLEGIEMDGTSLWRIDLGWNIRAGAHYTQFMVYDLDGDGKAEVACKTADGTTDNAGTVIGDGSADHRNGSGYVLAGPEFLTVFDGSTGNIITTNDYYPARGNVGSWGDGYGNRVDRFNAAIGYFDGKTPSLLMCRGYYTRTVLAAYDFADGELKERWIFDTNINGLTSYMGQGNHQISIADADGDGKDEVMFGAMCVDDDGTGLWTTGLGHGDALHVTDMIPDRAGLEVFGPHENDVTPGVAMKDAKTGEVLWQTHNEDIGRACAADIDPDTYGVEVWWFRNQVKSATNLTVGSGNPAVNFACWWDGDLSREMLSNTTISKFDVKAGQATTLLNDPAVESNNSTKATPNLQADIFGDWREEVIWRSADNTELRIYTTVIPTEYRIPTLMQDRQYREAIAWQNVGYNQPPHPGYYIGTGMFDGEIDRPPLSPGNTTLTLTSTALELTWERNFEDDFSNFEIHRSENGTDNFQLLTDTVKTTLFVDNTIVYDTEYFYYIRAKDQAGNLSTPLDTVSGTPTLRPDPPATVGVSAGPDQNVIFWSNSATAGVTGYNVYYTQTPGTDYQKLNTDLVTDGVISHTGLTSGDTYYYVARAVDSNGESFDSPEFMKEVGKYDTIQAEDGLWEGVSLDSNHPGFFGTGFANFNSQGWIEFKGVYAPETGWYEITTRHALANTPRTGLLIVNDSSSSFTMGTTSAFTDYQPTTAVVKLNQGNVNTIRFEATGSDFGNLDQFVIGAKTAAPVVDCAGVVNGTAEPDECDECILGNTGVPVGCYKDQQVATTVRIVAVHSGLCVTGGDKITQEDCGGQLWQFMAGDQTGYFKIKDVKTGQFLTANGALLSMADEGIDWRMEQEGDAFRLINSTNLSLKLAMPLKKMDAGEQMFAVGRQTTSAGDLFTIEDYVLSNEEGDFVTVYPNPVKDGLVNIQLPFSIERPTMQLLTLDGKILMKKDMNPGMNAMKLTGLSAGIYVMKVYAAGEEFAQQKLIIE